MRQPNNIARYGLILALAGLLSGAALAQSSGGNPSWTQTGSMNTSRFLHTATLRANGKIAFSDFSYDFPYQHSGISVMNPDGSGRTQLTSTQIMCPQPNRPPGTCGPDHLDWSPAWSPDGKQIAFIRSVLPGPFFSYDYDVFVMDADGSNQRRLTQSGSVSFPSRPAWSPDGTKIAFVGAPVGDSQIYVMNADGSGLRPIGRGGDPTWSPDGSKLAFGAAGGLYLMNPDGSGRTQITSPKNASPGLSDYDWQPAWSPDGSRILFIRSAGCDWDDNCESITIWTVNADGSNPAKLADSGAYGLAWSPDGTKIVFRWLGWVDRGDADRDGDLFTMDSDGSNITRLTNTPHEYESMPSWQAVAPAACPNPIDCADFFISQQYRDFLNREPEADGLQFYLNILNGCQASDIECIKYTRGALAANFFRSPEFKGKGTYVMYLYMVTLGQRPATDAELADPSKNTFERPHYAEFMADVQSITSPDDRNGPDPAKKAALTAAFVQRPEIVARYGHLTDAQFAQALQQTAGVTLADQSVFNGKTRAEILRIIAESPEVNARFYIQGFVTMEYFGFLRRNPDLPGYVFHNNRYKQLSPILSPDLTENFIVRGFIESPEYRRRFGP